MTSLYCNITNNMIREGAEFYAIPLICDEKGKYIPSGNSVKRILSEEDDSRIIYNEHLFDRYNFRRYNDMERHGDSYFIIMSNVYDYIINKVEMESSNDIDKIVKFMEDNYLEFKPQLFIISEGYGDSDVAKRIYNFNKLIIQ